MTFCFQGNRPLPLATLEKRQASWAKKKQILFYLFADDVDLRHRSDVALYYVSLLAVTIIITYSTLLLYHFM